MSNVVIISLFFQTNQKNVLYGVVVIYRNWWIQAFQFSNGKSNLMLFCINERQIVVVCCCCCCCCYFSDAYTVHLCIYPNNICNHSILARIVFTQRLSLKIIKFWGTLISPELIRMGCAYENYHEAPYSVWKCILGPQGFLTLNMLNCFEDYKICIHISYHILDFIQQKKIKVSMEQPYVLPILYCQCHACWCTGDFRSQCINRHGIDLQSRNIPSLASEELTS